VQPHAQPVQNAFPLDTIGGDLSRDLPAGPHL
jgi:hypothetical protein